MQCKIKQKNGLLYLYGLPDPRRELNKYRVMNPAYKRAVASGRRQGWFPEKWIYFAKIRGRAVIVPVCAYPEKQKQTKIEPYIEWRKSKIELRDYQKVGLEKWKSKHFGILKSAAGSGKTVIGCELIKQKGVRSLVIVPKIKIGHQWIEQLGMAGINAGFKEYNEDVCVCTYQTAAKNKQLAKEAELVLCDESHRIPCESIQTILRDSPAVYRYGCTATPWRSDGYHKALDWLIGGVTAEIETNKIDKHILKPEIKNIYYNMTPKDGDFNTVINSIASDMYRNDVIVETIKKLNSKNHMVLCLGHRVSQLEQLKNMVKADSVFLDAKSNEKEKRKAYDEIENHRVKILFMTYSLAGEGVDIPALSALIMLTPNSNKTAVEQAIGRICRPEVNKQNPVVYDIIDDGYLCYKWRIQREKLYKKLGYKFEQFSEEKR